jgi:hypothetical protein
VNKDTVLWTLVVFFGASIAFAAVRNATSDEGTGIALLAQLGVGALIVAAIVLVVRRRG